MQCILSESSSLSLSSRCFWILQLGDLRINFLTQCRSSSDQRATYDIRIARWSMIVSREEKSIVHASRSNESRALFHDRKRTAQSRKADPRVPVSCWIRKSALANRSTSRNQDTRLRRSGFAANSGNSRQRETSKSERTRRSSSWPASLDKIENTRVQNSIPTSPDVRRRRTLTNWT